MEGGDGDVVTVRTLPRRFRLPEGYWEVKIFEGTVYGKGFKKV